MERCRPLSSLNSFLSYALQLSSVQSLNSVQTPWTATCHASLSITNSWSLLSGAKFCFLIACILNSSFTLRSGRCARWLRLAFPELLSKQTPVVVTAPASSQFWEPSFTFGGQKTDGFDISCLLV